jgi:hypothetical protein
MVALPLAVLAAPKSAVQEGFLAVAAAVEILVELGRGAR